MPCVDLISVFGFFFELDLSGIKGNNDVKCLGKNHGSLGYLEMKTGGEKLRKLFYRGWGTTPPIAHKKISIHRALRRCASLSTQTCPLNFETWRPTPLRTPSTPLHPILLRDCRSSS